MSGRRRRRTRSSEAYDETTEHEKRLLRHESVPAGTHDCYATFLRVRGGLQAHWVNVSHILADQFIGFEEIDNGVWTVYFGSLDLGRFHERSLSIEDGLDRHKRR